MVNKTALVTGCNGFIGSSVAERLLADGYDVIGIARSHAVQSSKRLPLTKCIIGDCGLQILETINIGIHEIYHCAGSGSVGRSLADPINDFDSNVIATRNVLEFARMQGSAIVIPSSASIYGTVPNAPIAVNRPPCPISPYGYHKLIGELLAEEYADFFNVNVVVVRLFSVYGERLQKQLLWDAGNKLLAGQTIFAGTGLETRDWIHVEDAAALLQMAAQAAKKTRLVINGGTGHAVPIRDLLASFAKLLGISAEIKFDGIQRAGDPPHYWADTREARAIGWKPIIEIGDGLKRYADWFLSTRG